MSNFLSYSLLCTYDRFFVIANAITAAYLALSIPISIVCIIRPQLVAPRVLLIFLDIVRHF